MHRCAAVVSPPGHMHPAPLPNPVLDSLTLSPSAHLPACLPLAACRAQIRILETVLDVASAMQHIHSKSVIHGDLSPNNCLLAPCSKGASRRTGMVAKVADFGLSEMLPMGHTHISKARQAGTPFYVAPEVVVSCVAGLACS